MKKNDIHILIVDDDESIRNVLQEAIEKSGFKVTATATPAEAENLIKLKTVHLAVIDCMLPVINGVDLAKRLLNSSMKNGYVILISGVFRDDQFAIDAKKKSGAHEFFAKPFELSVLMAKINELLNPLLDAKTGSLESLLTKTEVSKREARKVLDYLENITGYDLMLVVSLLMRSKASGYLNVTDMNKKLVGFTFKEGALVDVDTLKNTEHLREVLVARGLVAVNDFINVVSGANKRDPLGFMVSENLISPHMERIIKIEKIMEDLKRLFLQSSVNVTFIENQNLEEFEVAINHHTMEALIQEIINVKIPTEWMRAYYNEWREKKIDVASDFSTSPSLKLLRELEATKNIVTDIATGCSLQDLMERAGEEVALRAVHYMVVCRLVCFTNEVKKRNLDDHKKRLEDMLAKINGKNPFEVFKFFGTGNNPPPLEVERIYKDFAKSNHPDRLAPSTPKDVVDLNNKVYSIISEAYSVLVSPEKRNALMDQLKEREAKNQINAEGKMDKAVPLLERSNYQEAIELLKEAAALYTNLHIKLYLLWARCKVEPAVVRKEMLKIKDELNEVDLEDRKSALYYFVSGLLASIESDATNAERFFNRALEYNKNFLAARRELGSLKSSNKDVKSKTTDFLTGDITSIVSGLFNKKKSG